MTIVRIFSATCSLALLSRAITVVSRQKQSLLWLHWASLLSFPFKKFLPFCIECFVLIFWPDEHSTTVIKSASVIKPPLSELTVGGNCVVRFGRQECSGQIAGIGKSQGAMCVY